jgi:hypothetical protein
LIARHFELLGSEAPVSPLVATVLLASVLRNLALEGDVDLSDGHDATIAWLATVLSAPDLVTSLPTCRHRPGDP